MCWDGCLFLKGDMRRDSFFSTKLCVWGGGVYCEWLVNFADFLFIVHAILLFQVVKIMTRHIN